jgi:hypothetical protein
VPAAACPCCRMMAAYYACTCFPTAVTRSGEAAAAWTRMTVVAKLTSAVAPSFEVAASGRLVGGWGRVAVAPAAVPVGAPASMAFTTEVLTGARGRGRSTR